MRFLKVVLVALWTTVLGVLGLLGQVTYVDPPCLKNVGEDGIFEFRSSFPIDGRVRIYDSSNTLEKIGLILQSDTFSTSIAEVAPSTFYFYSILDVTGDILDTGSVISSSISSGEVRVYFNYPVESSISNGASPESESGKDLFEAVLSYINNATESIDAAIYNNNRIDLVDALNNAVDRGVKVRYIADDETGNTAIQNSVLNFPVVFGNEGDALMHNKFFVIDANSDSNSWVLTGATNMTTGQIATDPNNLIAIQDKSLALIYTREFQEMWGSEELEPDPDKARFGSQKIDDTPHRFFIGNFVYQPYFSPSDETEDAIARTLYTADHTIKAALLLITSNSIREVLLDEFFEGVDIRMLINNESTPGSEFDFLQQQGVNIHVWPETNILHHKYAIIDESNPESRPSLITGSHNWTFSANTQNDENTLIIRDPDIVNIYAQEFEARWCQAGLAECITSTTWEDSGHLNVSVYPNPVKDVVNIELPGSGGVLTISDLLGRPVLSSKLTVGMQLYNIDLSFLNSGTYLLKYQSKGSTFSSKIYKL